MNNVETAATTAIKELFNEDVSIEITRPDSQFGDFSINIALQLAKKLGKNPREVAQAIADKLQNHEILASVEIAGPGFINMTLKDSVLYNQALAASSGGSSDQRLVLEYSCFNPLKEIHTGHLYQTIVWDALSRIYEHQGYRVSRATFGGDVGLHVGKAMYGIVQDLGGEMPEKLQDIAQKDRAKWLSQVYVAGAKAYEDNSEAAEKIRQYNRAVYQLHNEADRQSAFAQIYWTVRDWSYQYFEQFYDYIAIKHFDKTYPESQTMQPGLELVRSNTPEIFSESDGAVVLDESKSGLHTRVFITSEGLPTYETKDLGVISLEQQDFSYDQRIIATGNDQSEYMKVVFAAMKLIDPILGDKQQHVANGTVKFADGKKMSSRLGNVSRAVDVVDGVIASVTADNEQLQRDIGLGALKYAFLKYRLGGDIHFDIEQSISTEGNSGPYLQYALVRAKSVLAKYTGEEFAGEVESLDSYERQFASQLTRYGEAVKLCISDNSPHHLCQYLYDLAGVFNRFYENSRIVDDPRGALRFALVQRYEAILSEGLELLGMPTPDKM